jgi:hypothetical protein
MRLDTVVQTLGQDDFSNVVENTGAISIMTNNDPNRWLRYDPDEDISRHSATDPQKCRDMQKKYGWKLIDIEEIENKNIFEVDCVFKGKTEFPNYLEAKEEE